MKASQKNREKELAGRANEFETELKGLARRHRLILEDVTYYSGQLGIDVDSVVSVCWLESNFNPGMANR